MTQEEANLKLFDAARDGNLDRAKEALNAGADPAARDMWRNTPLHWAAENGRRDVARLLIEKGADPNAVISGCQQFRDPAKLGTCVEPNPVENRITDRTSHGGSADGSDGHAADS